MTEPTNAYRGRCYCGNVSFLVDTEIDLKQFSPRACDCSFCEKHAAAYFSDPDGALEIDVRRRDSLAHLKIGSGIADFLVCRDCGVLVGATVELDGNLHGTINSRIFDAGIQFNSIVSVSPKLLSDEEKKARWKSAWFTNVVLFDEQFETGE
ncbi:MAG: aldehyde-activating protein [Pseudomonadota bacterium]